MVNLGKNVSLWTITCKSSLQFINDTQTKGFCKFKFYEPKVQFSSHIYFLFMMSRKSQKFQSPFPTSRIIQFWSDLLPYSTAHIDNWTLNDLPSLKNVSISSLYTLTSRWKETLRQKWQESKHMLPESTFMKGFHTYSVPHQRTKDQTSLKEIV